MEGLELNQEKHWVLWKTDAVQAQKSTLGWRMLENNEISGILPFDYYYINNQICFRYSYKSLQRVDEFFQKKQGDFETLYFLCEKVLSLLEQGQEYLLDYEGYLLSPEWIFWSRSEKRLGICYLPGKKEERNNYTTLVEYLLRYTNHQDKKAVEFIYGLYDLLSTEGFAPEALRLYLQEIKKSDVEKVEIKETQVQYEKVEKKITTVKEDDTYILKIVKQEKENRFLYPMLDGSYETLQLPLQGEMVVGRERGSDLYLPFSEVSRRHALIIYEKSGFCLMDTSSTNGTYINGKQISAYVKTPCKENDIITFADISYKISREQKLPL